MRHLKRNLKLLAVLAGAVCAIPAAATTWTNTGLGDGQVGTNPAVGSGPCYTANQTNLDNQNCQFTITSGGQSLKVRAYSTRGADSTGLLRSAQIVNYTGGFAVTNATGDVGEGSAPEHATDNQGSYDLLVFELPAAGFDIESFMLGWAHEGSTYNGTATNEADVQAWFGGNNLGSDFNFSTACITTPCTNTGPVSAPTGGTLAYLGLTDITSSMNNPGGGVGDGGSNVPLFTGINFDGTQSGQYLVLAGKLADTDDFFKVKAISGSAGSGGQTPEPGTLALLALGLFGLVTLKRRSALA